MIAMVLEVELKFFEEKRAEWLTHHEGKFALVRGTEGFGFFDSEETAYERGVQEWGNTPFLVKQVLRNDRVEQMPALVCGLIHAGL